jgi:hypothetical protein
MAFALSIVKLEEAMTKPGCMICRMGQDAAVHSVKSMLYESTTDFQHRKLINDAYGFCPPHARMLVALELSNSGPLLGVNLIYEVLAKNLAHDLEQVKKTARNRISIAALLKMAGKREGQETKPRVLLAKEMCPACSAVNQASENTLSTLFEVIEKKEERFIELYRKSDGMCLQHLRIGLSAFMNEFPNAAEFLIDDAITRLTNQREKMLEYIRKHNWAYRGEQLTEEERLAWESTLTFFTGYPESRFNHKIDEF